MASAVSYSIYTYTWDVTISDNDHPYSKQSIKRSSGWYTEVIPENPNCYIDFEFEKPARVTAIYMNSIDYTKADYEYPQAVLDDWIPATKGDITVTNVTTSSLDAPGTPLLDPAEYGTECTVVGAESYDVTIIEDKRYFIGNFEVLGSDDKLSWTSLGSAANTTNTYKYMYLTNTQYFKYYRINILNNTGLNTTTFNTAYYGMNSLKFYSYSFSDDEGNTPIAAYNFDDIENPAIIKIDNAESILGLQEHIITETEEAIEGDAIIYTVSGTPYYNSYDVTLNSVATPLDYLANSVLTSAVVSGIAQDGGAGTLYIASDNVDPMNTLGFAYFTEVSGMPGYTRAFYSATGSQTVNFDTVQYIGSSDYTYTITASGLSTVSGSIMYDMEGVVERRVDTYRQQKDFAYRLYVNEVTESGTGTLASGTLLKFWGYSGRPIDMDTSNSILFEVTTGEAYNCRLTAWDDVTHSTLANELIQGDHARLSAMAYCCSTSKDSPGESKDPINLIRPPAHNIILKGNTVFGGTKYYYGDFDLVYRYQDDVYGDYLMFKPMLYGIHSGISYGVHDFIVTLHYSYT